MILKPHFLMDGEYVKGESGSPIYTNNGKTLIGILSVRISSLNNNISCVKSGVLLEWLYSSKQV